jgi:hypothetical protein
MEFKNVISKALKDFSKVDFLYEELEPIDKYKSTRDITSQISIFGPEHEGIIILNLDKSLVKYLYYNISEEELDDDDFTIEDFCGEITNIIAGKFIEFLDIDVIPSLPMINFEPMEYATMKKNHFNAFRLYDGKGHELFIYTYLTQLQTDF